MNSRPPSSAPSSWRHAKWLTFLELAIVLLLFVADRYHLVPFSKTPFLLLLGWLSLRLRGLRWKDVGLVRNSNWSATLAIGISAGIVMELFELFLSQPLLIHLTGKQPDLSVFRGIQGNVKYLLVALIFTWTLAAFGEELVYRGYLMNRVAALGTNTRTAWAISLVSVNILFGCAHAGQGITGIIENALDGAILGLLYLRCGRGLAVPIIAHGITDTADFILLFLGKYPGL